MIGIYNYSVLFTLFGSVTGLLGITYAVRGHTEIALLCLMICGFFDMFDGMVARTIRNRTEFEKRYGMQLDSLSDIVCFGVLPTMIGFSIAGSNFYFSALCIIYFIAAISRLTYFNVEEEMRVSKENGLRKTYTGLPVTASALIVPILYLTKFFTQNAFPIVFVTGLILIALLQVSKLKVPHLKMKGLMICLISGLLVLISLGFLYVLT